MESSSVRDKIGEEYKSRMRFRPSGKADFGFEYLFDADVEKQYVEELIMYDRQVTASQGFDVSYYRILLDTAYAMLVCLDAKSFKSYSEGYQLMMKLAAAEASKIIGLLGGQELSDLQLVKLNERLMGRARDHYITFIAKGEMDRVFRCYQAKVVEEWSGNALMHKVEFVWLKDERGTAKDITHIGARKGFDVDFIRRYYMNIFCAIEPVNPHELKAEEYECLMGSAADSYMDWSGEGLKDLQIEKADMQVFGLTTRYYITFNAKGSLDGKRRCYRAKVTCTYKSDDDGKYYTVESVGLVTAEE